MNLGTKERGSIELLGDIYDIVPQWSLAVNVQR